jgi:hypothetical protein
MLGTNQFEYLYCIPDIFGMKFVDDADDGDEIKSDRPSLYAGLPT